MLVMVSVAAMAFDWDSMTVSQVEKEIRHVCANIEYWKKQPQSEMVQARVHLYWRDLKELQDCLAYKT